MKKWGLLLPSLLVLAASLMAPAGTSYAARKPADADKKAFTGPKKRIAVMDVENKVTVTNNGNTTTTTVDVTPPSDFTTGLTEMLTTELVKTGRFIILERKALADIQAEQTLGTSGTADPDAAIKPGKIIGAQVLVRGALTEYSYKRSTQNAGGMLGQMLDVSRGSATATVALDIRMFDATTGQVIDSVRGEGKAKASGSAANLNLGDIKLGTGKTDNSPLGLATRQAIAKCVEEICARMEKMPWECNIAQLDGEGKDQDIYLNAGGDAGLKEGDLLDVVRPGKEIRDPNTHVVIGRTKDKPVGRLKINTIQPGIAIASAVEGAGFQIGDIARPAGPEKKQN